MSAAEWLSAMRDTTSDSAKTVHMLEMVSSCSQCRPMRAISSRLSSRVRAISSRNRPVPAAHLSFITKLVTPPDSSRQMTLLSWPPMSTMARASGYRRWAPRAWQVISVTCPVAKGMLFRP